MRKIVFFILLIMIAGCSSVHKKDVKAPVDEKKNNKNKKYVIAVMPVENQTGSMEYDEYIEDGIDLMIQGLERNKKSVIISKTAVKRLKAENEESQLIKSKVVPFVKTVF